MAYQSINPFTEQVLESFPEHTDAELETVLAAADAAYQTDWRHRSHRERATILAEAALILKERAREFAEIATHEMGKLLREAKEEVALSADILRYYADEAETMLAPRPLVLKRGEAMVHSAPIGVIFCIEPWNFPYYQLARVAGPNLMAGNTLVVKRVPVKRAVGRGDRRQPGQGRCPDRKRTRGCGRRGGGGQGAQEEHHGAGRLRSVHRA